MPGAGPAKYLPKPPGISFGDILNGRKQVLARKFPKVDTECDPHVAHFKPEQLEANVFCRILAAKPKLDTLTRLNLPSTLLTKIGYKHGEFTAVSSAESRLLGPRFYLAANCDEVPKSSVHRLIAKRPEFAGAGAQGELLKAAKDLLLKEMTRLAQRYQPVEDRKEVCRLTTDSEGTMEFDLDTNVPIFGVKDIDIELPSTIVRTKNGLKLAGLIYKYILFYK